MSSASSADPPAAAAAPVAAAAPDAADAGEMIRFVPPSSSAEPSFWMSYGDRKLNVLRLDESPTPLRGWYGMAAPPPSSSSSPSSGSGGGGGGAARTVVGARMRLDRDSLLPTPPSPRGEAGGEGGGGGGPAGPRARNECVFAPGRIVALNTAESFKRTDKNGMLDGTMLPVVLRSWGVSSDGDGGAKDDDEEEEEEEEEGDPCDGLCPLFCLSYLDLKRHVYLYWFAFPAMMPRAGRALRYSPGEGEGAGEGAARERERWRRQVRLKGPGGWGGAKRRALHASYRGLRERRLAEGRDGAPAAFLAVEEGGVGDDDGDDDVDVGVRCLPLTSAAWSALTDDERVRCTFAFLDPTVGSLSGGDGGGGAGEGGDSAEAETEPVGWALRNLAAYLVLRLGLGGNDARVLSYRPGLLRRIPPDGHAADNGDSSDFDAGDADARDSSLLLRIRLPAADDYDHSAPATPAKAETDTKAGRRRYRLTGYEPDASGRPRPRRVDLSPLLDPSRLARQATDLNLRLMKWRAIPDLDLDRLSDLRALLLGAGTLGCGVARTLQGWGVRRITLVDNGRVSYSNPVRQSLFTLADCEGRGRHKAEAAADALRSIAGPDACESRGVVLTIPMPGHPFASEAEAGAARADLARLERLVDECDAVFLLTDTRESRWLPTVLARARGRTLINAALGLDGWLVMRHGGDGDVVPPAPEPTPATAAAAAAAEGGPSPSSPSPQRLGCYFCNDVVAPSNSTRDRTLDQQCTVTRPGLAPIASAMATELLVALLHHPLGDAAPAPRPRAAFSTTADGDAGGGNGGGGTADEAMTCPLGVVPHQIRGSLASYTAMTPAVPAFRHCTGCGDAVVRGYREGGFDFVERACRADGAQFLEETSGLRAYREEAERKMREMEEAMAEGWDDEDGDGEDDF